MEYLLCRIWIYHSFPFMVCYFVYLEKITKLLIIKDSWTICSGKLSKNLNDTLIINSIIIFHHLLFTYISYLWRDDISILYRKWNWGTEKLFCKVTSSKVQIPNSVCIMNTPLKYLHCWVPSPPRLIQEVLNGV